MFRLTTIAAALFLIACFDFPRVYPLRPEPVAPLNLTLPSLPGVPDLFLTVAQSSKSKSNTSATQARLAIIRYVDGEFAHAVRPLPSDRHGFHYTVGKAIDANQLRLALAHGSAANPGDQVQVTNIEFREKAIIVSINGGVKKHFDIRQHLQIGIGAGPASTATPVNAPSTQIGAELVLEYGKSVPELSPDDLKRDLSPFLNFAAEHSSVVNWIETLPPEFQNAIKSHTAIVGMNHDMVLAALGRPDKKVREYDDSGRQTEDWIYGSPPEKTVLVTFLGDKVIRVKSYG